MLSILWFCDCAAGGRSSCDEHEGAFRSAEEQTQGETEPTVVPHQQSSSGTQHYDSFVQKGIMFEVQMDDEDQNEDVGQHCPPLPEQEVDPLNQTLIFKEGEDLKLMDWSEIRRGWSQRTPHTLLDELMKMDVNNTLVEAEQGESLDSS